MGNDSNNHLPSIASSARVSIIIIIAFIIALVLLYLNLTTYFLKYAQEILEVIDSTVAHGNEYSYAVFKYFKFKPTLHVSYGH